MTDLGAITREKFWSEYDRWKVILPNAPETICIPNYYSNPSGNYLARQVLEDQTSAALYWAINYKLLSSLEPCVYPPIGTFNADLSGYRSNEHLLSWALNVQFINGRESEFVLTYECHKFLDALDYLKDYGVWNEFLLWLETIYLPIVQDIAFYEKNNHGAWGWCAFLRSKLHLNQPIRPYLNQFVSHVSRAINDDGSMPYEARRALSGLWYIYFALAPYARVMFDIKKYEGIDLFDLLEFTCDWYFQYCLDPQSWPYRLPKNAFFKRIYQIFWPCSDELEVPQPDNWPANLLEHLATRVWDKPEWLDWIQRPIMAGGLNIFKYSTLTLSNNLDN